MRPAIRLLAVLSLQVHQLLFLGNVQSCTATQNCSQKIFHRNISPWNSSSSLGSLVAEASVALDEVSASVRRRFLILRRWSKTTFSNRAWSCMMTSSIGISEASREVLSAANSDFTSITCSLYSSRVHLRITNCSIDRFDRNRISCLLATLAHGGGRQGYQTLNAHAEFRDLIIVVIEGLLLFSQSFFSIGSVNDGKLMILEVLLQSL